MVAADRMKIGVEATIDDGRLPLNTWPII